MKSEKRTDIQEIIPETVDRYQGTEQSDKTMLRSCDMDKKEEG